LKKIIFIVFVTINSFAQNITFTEHIAPIIHQKCTPCHRVGEAAPFGLQTYEDVANRAEFIKQVIQKRYMPPFRADEGFGEFKNDRRLTQNEIDLITKWVDGGAIKGKGKVLQMADYQEFTQLGQQPDLVLRMNQSFKTKQLDKEEFMLFSMPTNLPKKTAIKAIEFRAGNRKLVHHARISVDTTHLMRVTDGKSINDSSIAAYSKIKMKEEFWYGWLPGNNPIIYPDGFAKLLPAEADLLVNIHYSPSPKFDTDSSIINLYFAKEPIQKEVQTFILEENDITNPPFVLYPNQKKSFYARSMAIPYDILLISVLPHLHVFGKSIRTFAITPVGEVIPLLKISDWDFDWQMTYEFKDLVKIPKGSIIYAEASYDNTLENPKNPFNPPKEIGYGWSTNSEMMNVIFQFVKE
jgi:hypothetical protein